jgi:eukaryotic-like serine/threonine-protein kinase
VLPWFLPDGKHFLYHRTSGSPEDRGIYIGSLDDPPEKQDSKRVLATNFGAVYVPSSGSDMGRLLFLTDDGTLMAQPFDARRLERVGEPIPLAQQTGSFNDYGFFSASANGVLAYRTKGTSAVSQLTWFDRQGKALGTAGGPGNYTHPALSPDGMRDAVAQRDPESEKLAVWMVDFSRGTTTRFTFGSASAGEPIWSPDGKRIVFESNPSGTYDLYQKPSDGATDEELLLKSSENKFPSDISRDGRFLLYDPSDPKTKYDIWVLPLQGDRKPFPFLRTEVNEVDAHFSPDGHWVAYMSDESGHFEVYVRRFTPESSAGAADASGKWQVSYGGGQEPQWGADGKELYYLTPDWKVMAVDVTTNPVFQAGTPKVLFQAPQQPGYAVGDYTIDGKRFLFLAPVQQNSQGQAPFTVVLNWQDTLKRQQ